GAGGRGATSDVAALLGWPVVLVLDVKGQIETAAAIASGCASHRDDVAVAGVILNRVPSARHLAVIQPVFDMAGVKLLGRPPDAPRGPPRAGEGGEPRRHGGAAGWLRGRPRGGRRHRDARALCAPRHPGCRSFGGRHPAGPAYCPRPRPRFLVHVSASPRAL